MCRRQRGGSSLLCPLSQQLSADIAHYTAEEEDAKSKAADEFIEWEIEESAVLLRNNNHALPLTKEEMGRVSLFGRATVDPYSSLSPVAVRVVPANMWITLLR